MKTYQTAFANKIDLKKLNQIIIQMESKYTKQELINYGMKQSNTSIFSDRQKYFTKNRGKKVMRDVQSIMPFLNKNNHVLDVGCGYGDYLAVFKHFGFSVQGINYPLYSEDFSYATNQLDIPVLYEDLNNGLSIADNSFDLVMANWIITLKSLISNIESHVQELLRITKSYLFIKIHKKMFKGDIRNLVPNFCNIILFNEDNVLLKKL